MKALKASLYWFTGLFVILYLEVVTPRNEIKKWKYLDSIYGNKVDGLDGDINYQHRVPTKFLRRYRWCALRNPINNLLREYGPNGTINTISEYETYRYKKIDAIIDGENYWFYQYRIYKNFHLWLGYRLMNDPRTNSELVEGHHFENTMLLWPFKNKRI